MNTFEDKAQQTVNLLNKIATDEPSWSPLPGLLGSPAYRYFEYDEPKRGRGKYRFCWTTETADEGKYWGIVCRNYKSKGTRKLIRKRGFVKRWKAKDWAYKQYCEHVGVKFRSLHRS